MELVTIKGIIVEIIYKNDENGYTVCEIESKKEGFFTAVGYMAGVTAGQSVSVTGKWTEHSEYGEQLKLEYYEILLPTEEESILKYLSSGIVWGIREATAKKLVNHFGKNVFDIMISDPLRLAEVKGISKEKARKIGEDFYRLQAMQNIVMFLQQYNISANFAIKINKEFGDNAIEKIKENPYLLADRIDGISFKTSDAIAFAEGFSKNSQYRIKSGIRYLLKYAAFTSGHTYLPENMLVEQASSHLGIEREEIENVLSELMLTHDIYSDVLNEEKVYYIASLYDAEQYCASRLAAMATVFKDELLPKNIVVREIEIVESMENIVLAEEQRNAVISAFSSGCVVLTGGPGTGKTTTINTILKIMKTMLRDKIALAAPTGRAAKRMTEVTGHEAKTIHRLLEAMGTEGETRFLRNEENPINADIVILDEVSMIDISLMSSFLRALRPGTRLILAGDCDQLPSVGAGNVLKDIINSGVIPVIRLEHIFRQAEKSLIVVNAHRINRGEYPEISDHKKDFFFLPCTSTKNICETITQLYKTRLPKAYNIDPISSIQVLSPSKKGIAGVINLNSVLQQAVNPPDITKTEHAYGSKIFRVGDKVMQIKNNYDMYYSKDNNEDGLGIFNGDMGVITDIYTIEKIMIIMFDDDKRVEYPFNNLDELELAYAVTVHKSQGSEFPVVIMPVCNFPSMLMCRNLFYTAVTRAKDMVILVGNEASVYEMTDNNRENARFTGLKERIIKKSKINEGI